MSRFDMRRRERIHSLLKDPLSPGRRLAFILLCLFCFLSASATAAEEGFEQQPRGPAERWCHARAFVNFNTWQLLVNLGNAIATGEATLVNAEEAEIEEGARYRLRKAVFDGNDARKKLLDFVEWQTVPASDPWASAHPVPNVTETGVQVYDAPDDDETAHRRVKRLVCLVPLIIVAAAVGLTAVGAAIGTALNTHRIRTLEQETRRLALDMDTHQERTAHMLAQAGITAQEIQDNFNKTELNVAMLINRTEQLSFAYRTRTDLANSITVLESLATVARDLPALVATINRTGVVHPAYVPADVWQQARQLLHHDDARRRLWLPETTGANASWNHANQTLTIMVPADCEADPTLLYRSTKLIHYNTSLVLKFSGWTDAMILKTEELQRYREQARKTELAIEKDRRDRDFELYGIKTSFAMASAGVFVFLMLVFILILVGTYYIVRTKRAMDRASVLAAEKGTAEGIAAAKMMTDFLALHPTASVPVPNVTIRGGDYEPVRVQIDPEQAPPEYYGYSAPLPASHRLNTMRLRKMEADEAAQESFLPRQNANPFV